MAHLTIRRLLGATLGVLVVAATLGTSVPARAAEYYTPAPDGTFSLTGHGYGHGHGLSQWGAYGAALSGMGWPAIVGFYYPGTFVTGQGDLPIAVGLSTGQSRVVEVAGGAGQSLEWSDNAGVHSTPMPAMSPGDPSRPVLRWRLHLNAAGGLVLDYVDSSSPTPTQWSTVPGLWARFVSAGRMIRLYAADGTSRDYRDGIRGDFSGSSVTTLSDTTMESYLRSVVPGEMPSSWSTEALRAQAVAARTYASFDRKAHPNSLAQTCDTTACQVYPGVARYDANGNRTTLFEASTSDQAVSATAGQVLVTTLSQPWMYAFTQFSASNGGWTVAASQPYLVAQADPYDGAAPGSSPPHTWTTSITAARIAGAYPGVGAVTALQIVSRDGNGEWGGRIGKLTIVGTAGSTSVSGEAFRSAMGLKSTWWTVTNPQALAQSNGGIATDINGDGSTDLLTTDAAGTMWFSPGTSGGAVGPATAVGSGWTMHNWVASPGDANGDGVPDLYAREAATGRLWFYPLGRTGQATSRRELTLGWNALDLIIPAGDVDGDGRPDLYGREARTGDLYLYRGLGNGSIAIGQRVNAGWQGCDMIIGGLQIDGSGRPGLICRVAGSGKLLAYSVSSTGIPVSARQINDGWQVFDMLVAERSADGQVQGLLGRNKSTGALVRYRVTSTGAITLVGPVGGTWSDARQIA